MFFFGVEIGDELSRQVGRRVFRENGVGGEGEKERMVSSGRIQREGVHAVQAALYKGELNPATS